MKKFLQKVGALTRHVLGMFVTALAFVFTFALATGLAMAQTDITSTVTTLSGYWTAISALAITVVLFILGRRLLRKV